MSIRNAFRRFPLIVNGVFYGGLYVGAEFSQQTITRKLQHNGKPLSYDLKEIKNSGIMGMVLYSPIFYFWYKWLDNRYAKKSVQILLKKLLLDQFVLTPVLLFVFFTGMSIMEEKKDIYADYFEKFVPTFKKSCVFWLPAQTLNFALVPPAYRVIYMGCCSFIWVNVLCFVKRT